MTVRSVVSLSPEALAKGEVLPGVPLRQSKVQGPKGKDFVIEERLASSLQNSLCGYN